MDIHKGLSVRDVLLETRSSCLRAEGGSVCGSHGGETGARILRARLRGEFGCRNFRSSHLFWKLRVLRQWQIDPRVPIPAGRCDWCRTRV